MPKPKVLLLCGGQSEEHDVSLASARSVVAAAGEQFEVQALVISKTGQLLSAENSQKALTSGSSEELSSSQTLQTLDSSFDVVFPLLHGPLGEDGSLQGMLKLMGLPFVGSDVLASAVGMDKLMMKAVFAQQGLPQVPYRGVERVRWRTEPDAVLSDLSDLSYPKFVKPANLGSSVGIGKATDEASLRAALDEAARHDRRIIVEQGLQNPRELEVAILGNDAPKASVVGEISFDSDFYDYDAKYTEGLAELIIPADIPDITAQQIQALGKKAFAAVDAAGLARVDFFLTAGGELYLNEINTMPGFTVTSMYPKLWAASGVNYAALIERLVALALEER